MVSYIEAYRSAAGTFPGGDIGGLISMVRDIMRDEAFLSRKAEPAAPEDLPVAQDLLDTLAAHKDGCVGMAAQIVQHEIDHCEGVLI